MLKFKLEELYTVKNGLSKPRAAFGKGYPFVSFSNVFNNYFIPSELKDLVDTNESERDNFSIKKGDILITRTSETIDELGLTSVALNDIPDATFNGFCKRLRPNEVAKEIIEPRYIGYYLRSPQFRRQVTAFSNPTTRASLRNSDLLSIDIEIPDTNTQKNIANWFETIDETIKTNKEIIQHLTSISKLIYYKFKEQSTNSIPLGDLVSIKYGKAHKALPDGNIPVYGSGGQIRTISKSLFDKESVLIPRKGTLNNIFYMDEPFWATDTMFFTEMKEQNICKYIYEFLNSTNLASKNVGSAVPSMTVPILKSLLVEMPDKDQLFNYDKIVSPLFQTKSNLIKENTLLQKTRDLLLPKIISGEIIENHQSQE